MSLAAGSRALKLDRGLGALNAATRAASTASSSGDSSSQSATAQPRQWTQNSTLKQLLAGARASVAASTTEQRAATVTVHGWVRSARVQKQVAFVDVNDGTTFWNLQVVMSPEQARRYE
jgi:lysyl-tRNA synthetase class II